MLSGSLCHAHLVVGEGELLVDPFNEIIPRDLISAAAAAACNAGGREEGSERASGISVYGNK